MRTLLCALSYFTRIPVHFTHWPNATEMRASLAWLLLIGKLTIAKLGFSDTCDGSTIPSACQLDSQILRGPQMKNFGVLGLLILVEFTLVELQELPCYTETL